MKLRLKMENSVRVDDAVLRANIMKKVSLKFTHVQRVEHLL